MQKLKLENIDPGLNASVKIACYGQNDRCVGLGWHLHPEYEIVFIHNGRGRLNIGSRRLDYEDGALVFLGPNVPHTDFGNDDHPDALEVVIQFDRRFVEDQLSVFPEFRPLAAFVRRASEVLLFSPEAKAGLTPAFLDFPKRSREGRLACLFDVLHRMNRPESYRPMFSAAADFRPRANGELKRLERIFQLINARYTEPLTSGNMARELSMTTNSFCRFFKREVGRPFTRFLNEYRLERAKEMLINEMTSIQEVAFSTGFRDVPYFNRIFRRHTGYNPSQWRDHQLHSTSQRNKLSNSL